jgi:tetratricopeptide (TPR) repeat protein
MKFSVPLQKTLLAACIAVIVFVCFRYTLHNQFTNWDDDYYVTNNQYITAFTPHNLKVIFSEDITRNNFHPLCILSLAVNYHFAGLEPSSYYLTNILIHIANAILVFILFIQLCRRLKMTETAGMCVGAIGGLWFGIHPMHVESVAWIAERKDVLYTFFYLLGLLAYLRYAETNHRKWFWIVFALFVASCLSKPMAVVFPLSLLCVDGFLGRPLGRQLVTEKSLFLLGSLAFGVAAMYTQSRTGAVASFSALTLPERVMFASYGFIAYIGKFLYPSHLSTFYPYPYRYVDGSLPFIYYAAPFLSVAILVLPAWWLHRRGSAWFRLYFFGMGFFLVNVIFVLQFISVGAAIMADRYSYVAYIGLLFMVALGLWQLASRGNVWRMAVVAVFTASSVGLAVTCAARTRVWHNSETLLSDAIEKYPYGALLSYKWRGHYYLSIGELDKALKDYTLLETLHAADDKVKANIERIHAMKALQTTGELQVANTVVPAGSYQPYIDSALAFFAEADTMAGLRKYIEALRRNPQQAEKAMAVASDALVQHQNYRQAVLQYNMLLKINATNPYYYFLRGCAHFGMGSLRYAITDWEWAVKMNSKEVQQSSSYNLSVAYDSVGEAAKAYHYITLSQKLGYAPTPDFIEKLRKKAAATQ